MPVFDGIVHQTGVFFEFIFCVIDNSLSPWIVLVILVMSETFSEYISQNQSCDQQKYILRSDKAWNLLSTASFFCDVSIVIMCSLHVMLCCFLTLYPFSDQYFVDTRCRYGGYAFAVWTTRYVVQIPATLSNHSLSQSIFMFPVCVMLTLQCLKVVPSNCKMIIG